VEDSYASPGVSGREVIVELENVAGSDIYRVAPNGEIFFVGGGELTEEDTQSVREYLGLAGINLLALFPFLHH